jgi:hypothetical protein
MTKLVLLHKADSIYDDEPERWSRKFGPFVKVDRMTKEMIRNGEERWSRKFGPFVKVDRMTKEMIRNGEEKDAYA